MHPPNTTPNTIVLQTCPPYLVRALSYLENICIFSLLSFDANEFLSEKIMFISGEDMFNVTTSSLIISRLALSL